MKNDAIEIVEEDGSVGVVPDAQADLLRLEDEIFDSAATVVRGASMFAEVPVPGPDDEQIDMNNPPDWWIARHGHGAVTLWRAANYARLPKASSPVGLDMAARVMVGLAKARATRNAAPHTLNVVTIAVTPMPEFERINVTKSDLKRLK
jgi:hypothetical protein